MAELKTVPAYVRVANDQEMLEIALIENIQREDLNPVEIGISYQRLLDECQLTHEEAGERLGKKRSTITNYLRLLKLPPDIQMGLKKEFISMGHAKVLLGVDDMPLQLSIFNEVVEKGLSVRQTEALIKGQQKAKAAPQKKALPYAYQKIQDQVSSYLSTKVDLKRKRDGKGEITLNFYSDSDLERLIDLIITD